MFFGKKDDFILFTTKFYFGDVFERLFNFTVFESSGRLNRQISAEIP